MYRVMLVDDEPWALSGLENILDWADQGFTVQAKYTSSSKALQAIYEQRPDVVFTDVRMPRMSGVDLVRAAREAGGTSEFVIVSAHSDFHAARKALNYGAMGYVLKPLNREEILEVLGRLRAKLDAHLSQRLSIRLGDPASITSAARKLGQAVSHPHCCVLLCALPPSVSPSPAFELHPFQLEGVAAAYLLAAGEKQLPADFPPCHSSLWHSGCLEFSKMLTEAVAAFHGDYAYVEHPVCGEIQAHIGDHYAQDLSLGELAERFFLSETYLCELFKKHTGETIGGFIQRVRLCNAARLLRESDQSVKETAYQTGFRDVSYFGRRFKRWSGYSPEEYRLAKRIGQVDG